MQSIGFAILLGMGGTIVGALYTFVIGFAGIPGAILTEVAMRRAKTNLIPTWGLVLTLAGQLYVALTFVALVVLTTANHLSGMSGPGTWLAWIIAFFVSTLPGWAALKNSALSEGKKNVQHGASVFTAPLSAVGFFVFVFFPSALRPLWGWIPMIAVALSSLLPAPHGSNLPERFRQDRTHLSAAFAAFGRVTDLTQPPPGQESFQVTAQHDSLVVAALREGLAAGDSVSVSFLDWLHPEMRDRFRNEYLAGQRFYLQGLLEQDPSKQIRGIQSIDRWYKQFWSVHNHTIAAKAFGD